MIIRSGKVLVYAPLFYWWTEGTSYLQKEAMIMYATIPYLKISSHFYLSTRLPCQEYSFGTKQILGHQMRNDWGMLIGHSGQKSLQFMKSCLLGNHSAKEMSFHSYLWTRCWLKKNSVKFDSHFSLFPSHNKIIVHHQ